MKKPGGSFGGDWTSEKLERVRKYLCAYMQIMKNRPFRVAYIDAFAGTGYVKLAQEKSQQTLLLPDAIEMKDFIDGSARIALQVEPRFDKYIFIERGKKRKSELEQLKDEFPALRDDIDIQHSDANVYIKELCGKDWRKRRAVMFLDPYGMQVTWDTIEAIARTKGIDLWILFPLGVAINRLIKRNGIITPSIRRRLDRMFGATDWFDEFYQRKEKQGLFDDETGLEKVANFKSIGEYFKRRLNSIFPGVAENPLPLTNSRNNPLYLLCFAAANEKGAPTAVKIAQHILRR